MHRKHKKKIKIQIHRIDFIQMQTCESFTVQWWIRFNMSQSEKSLNFIYFFNTEINCGIFHAKNSLNIQINKFFKYIFVYKKILTDFLVAFFTCVLFLFKKSRSYHHYTTEYNINHINICLFLNETWMKYIFKKCKITLIAEEISCVPKKKTEKEKKRFLCVFSLELINV